MGQALALARRGLGNCWPNPAVGCVLVKDGQVLARGWTQPGGRPHAEAMALAAAGPAAKGATAYVTLEPCAHTGRALPCSNALIAAGVARVVVAVTDPDPRINGGGIALLRSAGIEVTTGLRQAEAAELNRGFFLRITQQRPLVTLKLATSLDGRIATASGESRWITGPEARHLVHGMRLSHDAVMIGGGTALADDPVLTVRGYGPVRQPVRVVLSRLLDLPEGGRLAASAAEVPLWLVHGMGVERDRLKRWEARGARLISAVMGQDGKLNLRSVLRELAEAGLTRVFAEGGGQMAAALLKAGLVDDLALFTAGKALGSEGRPSLGPLALELLSEAPQFSLLSTRAVGGDALQLWRRQASGG